MQTKEKIIALGVGRSGCQMVDHMLTRKIEGVALADMRFRVTPDLLSQFTAPLKFNVQSEEDCRKIIGKNFRHADIMFVIGDSPLTPYAAKAAKDLGILTIGIPLSHNEELNAMLRDASDALIQLGGIIVEGITAFVQDVVESISGLITKQGFVNLDADDVKNILRDVGTTYFRIGKAAGEYRAKVAALRAARMFSIKNAKRILLNITTGHEVSLGEMSEVAESIEKIAAPDVQVIWGHVIDENMGNEFQVTFVAGMDDKMKTEGNSDMQDVQGLLDRVSDRVHEFDTVHPKAEENFNVFEILDVETREVKICRFLYELLSPSGSHHLGILFLKSFVKNVLGLDIPDEELENADVSREYTIENGRRIDILIRTEHHCIPIEVKIYAWDLKEQCRDYCEYAERLCGNAEDARVFYITPDGHEPSPESSCGVPVKCISFDVDVYEWISDCIAQLETAGSAPVREVLRQFAATIKKFAGRMEDKLKMEIAELIAGSWDNMEAAGKIVSSLGTALQMKLFGTVEKMMLEKGYTAVKGKGLYYADQSCKTTAGLFYNNAEGDDAKPGVRFDVEEYYGGPWVYVGEFTLKSHKWGKKYYDKVSFPDGNEDVNFGRPEHLSRLCNEKAMERFAGYCVGKIEAYLDNVNSSQNNA